MDKITELDSSTQDSPQDAEFIQITDSIEGELCLRFKVPSGKEFALPASGVREVMTTTTDRIIPIPNASPFLLGTFNWRGQVIWVADLGQFMGDQLMVNTDRTEIPVLIVEEQGIIMGFAVDSIANTEWLDLNKMEISGDISDLIRPFLIGEYLLPGKEQIYLKLIDQVSILRSPRWAT